MSLLKLMHSRARLGANRNHSRSYGEDLQRGMVGEGAISYKRFGGTEYWSPGQNGLAGDPSLPQGQAAIVGRRLAGFERINADGVEVAA